MRRFDLTNMALGLLPVCLRRPLVAAIVRSAVSVLGQHHDTLDTAHNGAPYGTMYRLRHTGQVCSLESLLNDRHDPESRRIVVRDCGGGVRTWLYTDNEISLQPDLSTWLWADDAPLYVLPDADYADQVVADFVVLAPREIETDEASLRVSIDDTKIAGVGYAIEYT